MAPEAGILEPLASAEAGGKGAIRTLPQLTGTASDNVTNESVQIAMRKLAVPALWYDGADFSIGGADPNWIFVVNGSSGSLSPDATSWAYAPAGLDSDFAPGIQYLILARSTDVAGNLQTTLNVQDISRNR